MRDVERKVLEKPAKSQTAPARMVERAKTIVWVYAGEQPSVIAQKLERATATIYQRLKRFAQNVLNSLHDQPQAGRPLMCTEAERGQMIITRWQSKIEWIAAFSLCNALPVARVPLRTEKKARP